MGGAGGGPWAGGAERKDGTGAGGRGKGCEGTLWGVGIIEIGKKGPGAVDGMGKHLKQDFGVFGCIGVHGGFPPRSQEGGWADA